MGGLPDVGYASEAFGVRQPQQEDRAGILISEEMKMTAPSFALVESANVHHDTAQNYVSMRNS